MFYGYNDPNDYWLPPQQNVDPEDAMKLGCSCAIGYVVAFFIAILICALFSSCGSYKKTVKEDTHQTETVTTNTTANSQRQTNATSQSSSVTQNTVTERTDDSTEVVTITETTWYDTSKADSTGNSPVLKTEKTTTIKHNGKRTERQENENRESEQTNALSSTNSSAVIKEESATRDETKSSERNTAATETKQLSYAAWALLALSLLIIVGVLAYWVKSKYRQRG